MFKKLVLLLPFSALTIFADTTAVVAWEKIFGKPTGEDDNFQAIAATADSGFALAGSTESWGNGNGDVWLLKINGRGDSLWAKTYALGVWGYAQALIATADGGFAMTGTTKSSGADTTLNPLLIKTDGAGTAQWVKALPIPGNNRGYALREAPGGDFIVAGSTTDLHPDSARNILVVRTDAQGDTLWTRVFGTTYYDMASDLAVTPDSGFAVTGIYDGGEGWLARFDKNGDSLWTRQLAGSYYDELFTLLTTPDGGFIAAGYSTSFGPHQWNNYDAILVRYNAAGDTLWTRTFGNDGDDRGEALAALPDGGFVLAANVDYFDSVTQTDYSNDRFLYRTDSLGNLQWSSRFGSLDDDYVADIAPAADGGFVLSGYRWSLTDYEYQATVLKASVSGNTPPYFLTSIDSVTAAAPHGGIWRDTLSATDPDGDDLALIYSLAGRPDTHFTLTMVDDSGPAYRSYAVLTWSPVKADTGTDSVRIRVSDAAGSADFAFALSVTNTPPRFSARPDSLVTLADTLYFLGFAGETFGQTVAVFDPDDPGLPVTVAGAPAGFSVTAGNALAWTPQAADTGAYLFRLIASDPFLRDTQFINIVVMSIPPGVFPEGALLNVTPGNPLTLSVAWPDSNQTLTLKFRLGGSGGPDDSLPMVYNSQSAAFQAVIPGNLVTINGIVYAVGVRDSLRGAFSTPYRGIALKNVLAVKTDSLKLNAYQMTGIPVLSADSTPAALIGDDLGTADHWRLFGYAGGGYVQNPALFPGRGFWLATDRSLPLSCIGQTANPVLPFRIPLDSGWSLIANPFPFPVYWENATVKKDSLLHALPDSATAANFLHRMIFTYQDASADNVVNGKYDDNFDEIGGAYESQFKLKPWTGYWVLAQTQGCTLLVSPSGVAPAGKAMAARNQPSWRLSLHVSSGAFSDQADLGLSPRALPGDDPLDAPKPPLPTRELWMGFPHPEWGRAASFYGTDTRPVASGRVDFRLRIGSERPAGAVTLSWPRASGMEGFSAYLVDSTHGTVVDMAAGTSYRFLLDKQHDLTVSLSGTALALSRGVPEAFDLSRNFPNPFNPSTSVRISVPLTEAPARLSVAVYDAAGRHVATLAHGTFRPGRHILRWDGLTGGGRPAATGVYYVRMRCTGFHKTGKILLCR